MDGLALEFMCVGLGDDFLFLFGAVLVLMLTAVECFGVTVVGILIAHQCKYYRALSSCPPDLKKREYQYHWSIDPLLTVQLPTTTLVLLPVEG